MGRGRQKAKQTKVARKLKYFSPNTDLDALQRELTTSEDRYSEDVDDADDQDDEDDDLYSKYADLAGDDEDDDPSEEDYWTAPAR
ncbi:DUF3073 domain-containing protein [Actinomyces sp. B33]|uniref:DUF3073 domain-containing protein n=1 Tax=Actinomyces sp. B33 TaxID=2942131 RepID=UPI002342592C|nr:DUF3073 domain-containing protein [Actinomyces sp. B33]MDC4233478.1 DUF3073 domain-containing protein [Actinomyces sp. B33]